MIRILLAVAIVSALAFPLHGQSHPVTPYVDPSELDCPWPKYSFYKEPWRGYLETRPGELFIRGIGVNYNAPPAADDLAVRLLAECGFRSFRIEIGWDQVAWDESHLNNEKRLAHLLQLCKQYGIRPNLLLNANHGAPCPMRSFQARVAEDAPKGSRTLSLVSNAGIEAGRTGISNLTGYWAAEVFILGIDSKTGKCELSKPLPKALKRDQVVQLSTLKYLPFFPVGTSQFEETAAGWLRYAKLVTKMTTAVHIDRFDVEIWNELSFGSNFTDARNYYSPAPFKQPKNFLLPGGSCWELARRTVAEVKQNHPGARCIWGFSNTTFFHCPIPQLPPGMDGQSYHPYGTGTRTYPKDAAPIGLSLEGFVPTMQMRMPEGWAHLFIKTESLMRLLNPQARSNHPPGVDHFHHYITEHGVAPMECGVTDDAGSWDLKTKCVLRSYCLWLNKGIDSLDYFCAWENRATGMGLLPPDLEKLPPESKWQEVATPPMRAIRNLVSAFAGTVPLTSVSTPLIEATELTAPQRIFNGDGSHPPLWQREALAVLPFQVDQHKWVVAVYAMTYDATARFTPQEYRLKFSGFPQQVESAALSDPASGSAVPVRTLNVADHSIEVEMSVTDSPRLLTIVCP